MDKEDLNGLKDKIVEWLHWFVNEKIKKLTNKQKIIIIMLIGLLVGCGSFSYVMAKSSKSTVVSGFEKTLNSKNPYKIYKYMKSGDPTLEINEETVKPFVDYLNENPDRKREFVNTLRYEDSSKDLLKLKSEEGFWGLKYYIELSPVNLNINVNLENTKLYLNEKEIYDTKEEDSSINIGHIFPGAYNLKSIYTNEYGQISESKNISVLSYENNIDVKLQGVKLTLDSNYRDSDVFINGDNSGKTVEQFQKIGPIPSDGSCNVYVERQFPWGSVKSEEKSIGDSGIMKLDLSPLTDDLRMHLEEVYKDFYNNLFKALTDSDKGKIKNTSNTIKDELYNKYYEKGFIIKNSYELKDLKWEQNNISMKYEGGKYKTYAIAEISYQKQKTIVFIPYNEETINKSFMTELTYDENNDSWVVTKVEEIINK